MEQKQCPSCGKTFARQAGYSNSQWEARLFCSLECRANARRLPAKVCPVCSRPFRPRGKTQSTCSWECRNVAMRAPEKPCFICGKSFHARHGNLDQLCCSSKCATIKVSQGRKGKVPVAALAALQRPEVQAKLREYRQSDRNPINDPDVRRRALEAAKAKGYGHFLHGGNQPMPKPQQALADRLGWETEVVVRTNQLTGRARSRTEKATPPYKYTLDIAERSLRIDIEVDGPCHRSRKERDARRDAKMMSLGWTVLRFTNREIQDDLEAVTQRVLKVAESITSRR